MIRIIACMVAFSMLISNLAIAAASWSKSDTKPYRIFINTKGGLYKPVDRVHYEKPYDSPRDNRSVIVSSKDGVQIKSWWDPVGGQKLESVWRETKACLDSLAKDYNVVFTDQEPTNTDEYMEIVLSPGQYSDVFQSAKEMQYGVLNFPNFISSNYPVTKDSQVKVISRISWVFARSVDSEDPKRIVRSASATCRYIGWAAFAGIRRLTAELNGIDISSLDLPLNDPAFHPIVCTKDFCSLDTKPTRFSELTSKTMEIVWGKRHP